MNRIRCIIVDDEPLAVEMLANYVRRTPALELAGSYTDPVLALSEIRSAVPDLVFMDIQMPDLTGLELSRMVPEQTLVIFTTAFKEYAFDSYQIDAVDYLLKPIRYQKFLEAVAKAEKRLGKRVLTDRHEKEKKSVFVKVEGEYRNIELEDILYVSGMKDYVLMYLASEPDPLVVHITMKSVEEILPSEMFMRVHRSHIVSLGRITAVDASGDVCLGSVFIPVSETYRKDLDGYVKKNLLSGR